MIWLLIASYTDVLLRHHPVGPGQDLQQKAVIFPQFLMQPSIINSHKKNL